ncbi:hypothetical protein [uncultured Pyramidobacter sp.]|uniref:hypothetical protein n=1 Tax=uncultured Pyramidobacter sp. TaxID=1623495 RepID=UPI0028058F08|nr:hypothetical protein [uncultured Pyramidobacter sp.]
MLEAQRVLSGPAAHRILAGQSYAEELSGHAVACVPATHSPSSAIPSTPATSASIKPMV